MSRPSRRQRNVVAVWNVLRPAKPVYVTRRVEVLPEEGGRSQDKGLVIIQGTFLFTKRNRSSSKVLIKCANSDKMPVPFVSTLGSDVVTDPEITYYIPIISEEGIMFT